MTAYLLLFRGVGGKTQLPVKSLRAELLASGFEQVGTYINSGNAYLVSDKSAEQVRAEVSELVARCFDFKKEIYVLTRTQWKKVARDCPFLSEAQADGKKVHAAWLAAKPKPEAVETVRAFAVPGERLEIRGKTAYLHTPFGFGKSKFAEKFDSKIGVENTARNFNTVFKLLELLEALK